VAIYRIFERSAFAPEDTKRMGEAYELALVAMGLKDRKDPLTEIIAKTVIEVAQTGVKEPAEICALAVKRIRD
jgi:hypothetical protein